MCLLYYLGCCHHFLSREVLDILVNNIRSSGIRICQGFVVRGFQTVSLFVKDVEVFLQVTCTLCVRGFYGLGIGRFLHVQSVGGFGIKGFFRSFLLLFCGFTVCQMVFSGSLCLSKFWVSEHCFVFFGLVCQRFQGLNVGGFLWVCVVGYVVFHK